MAFENGNAANGIQPGNTKAPKIRQKLAVLRPQDERQAWLDALRMAKEKSDYKEMREILTAINDIQRGRPAQQVMPTVQSKKNDISGLVSDVLGRKNTSSKDENKSTEQDSDK